MSIYGIDGTDTWQRGPKTRKRDGRYTEIDADDAATDGFRPVVQYECKTHGALQGDERCLCCGRTRNEIALDGDR